MNKKKILLFSGKGNTYSIIRLREEIEKRGYQPIVVHTKSLIIRFDRDGKIQLHISPTQAKEIQEYYSDVEGLKIATPEDNLVEDTVGVIIRVLNYERGIKVGALSMFVNQFFEQQGIPVFSGNRFHIAAYSKLLQHNDFIRNNIPVVPSAIIGSREAIADFYQMFPEEYFVKPYNGSHGDGAGIATSAEDIERLYTQNEDTQAYTLIQKRLKSNWDLRIIFIDGEIVGAMKKTAAEGAIVTNFSAGGSVEAYELSEEERDLVNKVIQALHPTLSGYGGIDIMYDEDHKPYVLEINTRAEFKGFEQSTGINVAGKIVDSLLAKSKQS